MLISAIISPFYIWVHDDHDHDHPPKDTLTTLPFLMIGLGAKIMFTKQQRFSTEIKSDFSLNYTQILSELFRIFTHIKYRADMLENVRHTQDNGKLVKKFRESQRNGHRGDLPIQDNAQESASRPML